MLPYRGCISSANSSLLITGMSKSIDIVSVHVQNAEIGFAENLKKEGFAAYWMFRSHEVLDVTLKTGERLAIDLLAAAYGWRETISPWDVYVKNRVFTIIAKRTIHDDTCPNGPATVFQEPPEPMPLIIGDS